MLDSPSRRAATAHELLLLCVEVLGRANVLIDCPELAHVHQDIKSAQVLCNHAKLLLDLAESDYPFRLRRAEAAHASLL
jgi:hypothetical protein